MQSAEKDAWLAYESSIYAGIEIKPRKHPAIEAMRTLHDALSEDFSMLVDDKLARSLFRDVLDAASDETPWLKDYILERWELEDRTTQDEIQALEDDAHEEGRQEGYDRGFDEGFDEGKAEAERKFGELTVEILAPELMPPLLALAQTDRKVWHDIADAGISPLCKRP